MNVDVHKNSKEWCAKNVFCTSNSPGILSKLANLTEKTQIKIKTETFIQNNITLSYRTRSSPRTLKATLYYFLV